jgi:hypothetical protein
MSLTSFRQAVAAELQADLRASGLVGATTFKILPGEPLAGPKDTTHGYCWAPARAENEDNANQEHLELRVRVYKRYTGRQQPSPTRVIDPSDLEALGEAIYESLREKQAADFGVWFLRCVATEIAAAERYVEVTIVALQSNLFAQE